MKNEKGRKQGYTNRMIASVSRMATSHLIPDRLHFTLHGKIYRVGDGDLIFVVPLVPNVGDKVVCVSAFA